MFPVGSLSYGRSRSASDKTSDATAGLTGEGHGGKDARDSMSEAYRGITVTSFLAAE